MSIDTVPQLPTRVGSPEICARCDQTVAKARTKSGKTILMDFHPSQLGKFVISAEREGWAVVSMQARYLSPDDERPRFSCHWNHCRGGGSKRRSYGRPEINYSPLRPMMDFLVVVGGWLLLMVGYGWLAQRHESNHPDPWAQDSRGRWGYRTGRPATREDTRP